MPIFSLPHQYNTLLNIDSNTQKNWWKLANRSCFLICFALLGSVPDYWFAKQLRCMTCSYFYFYWFHFWGFAEDCLKLTMVTHSWLHSDAEDEEQPRTLLNHLISEVKVKNQSSHLQLCILVTFNNIFLFLGPRGPLVLPSVGPVRPVRPALKIWITYIQAYMPYESWEDSSNQP